MIANPSFSNPVVVDNWVDGIKINRVFMGLFGAICIENKELNEDTNTGKEIARH